MQRTVTTKNILELETLAQDIAETIQYPSVFLLSGDLGSGKTAFTKALAKALGIKKHVSSPTFLIHKRYTFDTNTFHHYDLYRLSKFEELQEIGFEEALGEHIIVIEWPEKIKNLSKIITNNKNFKKITKINFYHTNNQNQRKIVIYE